MSQWFDVVTTMITSILIARWLGPDRVGQMAFCFGLIGLFMMITTLGFAQAHLKRVAEGMPLEQCIGAYGAIVFVLNGFALLAVLAAWSILMRTLQAPSELTAFVLFLAYVMIQNFSQVFIQTFEGKQEAAKIALCTISSKCVRLVAVTGMLCWKRSLTSVAIAFICEAGAQMGMAIRLLPRLPSPIRVSRKVLISYWEYAKPVLILTPVSTLMDTVDRVILGVSFSSAQLGYYSIARNMYEAFKSIPSAVLTVLAPRLATEFSAGDRAILRQTFRQTFRKMMLIMTPVTVVSMALAPLVIRSVYGPTYLPAAKAAAAFFFVGWVVAALIPFQYLLLASERHKLLLKINPVTVAVYLGTLWGVGHWHGSLTAASLAQLALWLIPAVPVYWAVKDLTGIGFPQQIFRITVGGLAMAACFVPVRAPQLSPYWALAVVLPAGVIYLLLIRVLKEGTKEDLKAFWKSIHLGDVWRYARSETAGTSNPRETTEFGKL